MPDTGAVVPVVEGLWRDVHRVIRTQDSHPPGHVSFASRHPGERLLGRVTLPAGLATDHCVLHTALEAPTLGYRVTVIERARPRRLGRRSIEGTFRLRQG